MESSQSKQASRLTQPVRITEQTWPEGTVPVVSVFCITYNHEKFIRDAIEGFLMQQTTFPVEIFIHDDASEDGTAQIVKEYAARYPQLFWTVLQTENQWSKGNKKILWDYLARQRGEFIAMCEGDDYWTSPHKLEKQVNFLLANQRCALVHHLVDHFQEAKRKVVTDWPPPDQRKRALSASSLVWFNFIATCAVMLRAKLVSGAKLDTLFGGLDLGDWPLWAWVGQQGDVGYLEEKMGVYRIHESNVWYNQNRKAMAASLQLMDKRLAKVLKFRSALPWCYKVCGETVTQFYDSSFHGRLWKFALAAATFLKEAWCIRPAFALYVLSMMPRYSSICVREGIKNAYRWSVVQLR